MSRNEQSCCCPSETSPADPCRVCRNHGTPVSAVTIESLVHETCRSRLASPDGFSFCRTPDCPVVYFNNSTGDYIGEENLKVRVGVKESEDPAHLCYCFGWTKKKIADEIAQTGSCRAVGDIMNRIKESGCNCERTNPSGRCCLKDVADYIAAVSMQNST